MRSRFARVISGILSRRGSISSLRLVCIVVAAPVLPICLSHLSLARGLPRPGRFPVPAGTFPRRGRNGGTAERAEILGFFGVIHRRSGGTGGTKTTRNENP